MSWCRVGFHKWSAWEKIIINQIFALTGKTFICSAQERKCIKCGFNQMEAL